MAPKQQKRKAGMTGETPGPEADATGQTIEWPIRRYRSSGEVLAINDVVVREQRIELVVNNTHLLAMLALPRDVEALALGFLVSEGLCRDRKHLPEIKFDWREEVKRRRADKEGIRRKNVEFLKFLARIEGRPQLTIATWAN